MNLFQRGWAALTQTALDFFFPPRCAQCNRFGSWLCADCDSEIPMPPAVREDGHLDVRAASAAYTGSIRRLIRALKYTGTRQIAPILAARLVCAYHVLNWQADLVVPLPLHPKRLAKRGYNQSDLLARAFAAQARLCYAPRAVARLRDTPPQVGLSAAQRRINVASAFAADPSSVSGKRVVVIDDVYTTGATLLACAEALRMAGAAAVCGLTVAFAPRRTDTPHIDTITAPTK